MSGVFTYDADGGREAFDPATTAAHLAGCLLCRCRAIVFVGVFMPTTDEMRRVVLLLRQHAQRPNSTPAVAYGLCACCVEHRDVCERVERALERAAARITIQ